MTLIFQKLCRGPTPIKAKPISREITFKLHHFLKDKLDEIFYEGLVDIFVNKINNNL